MPFPVQQPATVKEEPRTPPQLTKLVIEMERQPSQVSRAGSISPIAPLPEAEAGEDEEDQLGRRRVLTRSGSITEQVVDTPGGFRKLVLEMTSSSEEAEAEGREAKEGKDEEERGENAGERKEEDRHKGPEKKKKRRKKKSHKKKKHSGAGSSTGDGDGQEGVPLLGSGEGVRV
jgi:hypothetical protein